MKNIVDVKGMEFYAYHGCFDQEKKIGTNFKVDVSVEYNFMEAAINDDINSTINYVLIHSVVKECIAISSNIIENVAYRIIYQLKLKFPLIKHCFVTIYKLNPVIGGKTDWVSVTIEE